MYTFEILNVGGKAVSRFYRVFVFVPPSPPSVLVLPKPKANLEVKTTEKQEHVSKKDKRGLIELETCSGR